MEHPKGEGILGGYVLPSDRLIDILISPDEPPLVSMSGHKKKNKQKGTKESRYPEGLR
jgi:hypothetical protein